MKHECTAGKYAENLPSYIIYEDKNYNKEFWCLYCGEYLGSDMVRDK
jgi:hypothetical protein